ncbi:hypothetical protein LTS10_004766 [Elasticomyces elasticus]|nr:hypothetical protein LTS10_004766 [Elasticomyces elasticus]
MTSTPKSRDPRYAYAPPRQEQQSSRPVRLLDTSTLTFAHVDQPYAILSHTWTLGTEEVSYKDVCENKHRTKAGWLKIAGACRQAKKDGVAFLWVDTCCIDKSNNSELGEAINSMFAWYQGAAVCYVHMADVSISSAWWDDREPLRSKEVASWKAAGYVRFSHSRWFHRGWTLQEMLAPKFVRFYAQDWAFLGALYPLRHTVSYITGVPVDILGHQKPLSDCSIAQRLSWAAGRQVSKVEDNAYSLLGILGVPLSLNYGEGAHAFIRLQEEILKRTSELSVLAWCPSGDNKHPALLATSPADFQDCGHVELVPEKRASDHWMTSSGLKGSFSLVLGGSMLHYLSLNCRLNAKCPSPRPTSNQNDSVGLNAQTPGANIYLLVRAVPTTTKQEQQPAEMIGRAMRIGESVALSISSGRGVGSLQRVVYSSTKNPLSESNLKATIKR